MIGMSEAICAVGNNSEWSSQSSFTTLTAPTCSIPSALALLNVSASSANLSWTENGTATQWEISYGTPNFQPGNGIQIIANSSSLGLTGLMAGSNYDWYVRAICASGNTSEWSDRASFATLSAPPCLAPGNLVSSNLISNTVDLSWIENGTATQWEISYGLINFTPGNGIQITTSSMHSR